jgi:hypothetical protein
MTPSDIDLLNAFARDLAHKTFHGHGSVVRTENGIVQLMLVRNNRKGAGSVYRTCERISLDFESASRDIYRAVQGIKEQN